MKPAFEHLRFWYRCCRVRLCNLEESMSWWFRVLGIRWIPLYFHSGSISGWSEFGREIVGVSEDDCSATRDSLFPYWRLALLPFPSLLSMPCFKLLVTDDDDDYGENGVRRCVCARARVSDLCCCCTQRLLLYLLHSMCVCFECWVWTEVVCTFQTRSMSWLV